MIVIEGVDNSGKSTLIKTLKATVLKEWPVQVSEGPPKHPFEMNERVRRYLSLPDMYIYDRHPCVSQPIYGLMRTHRDDIDPLLIHSFYELDPFFVYCDPGNRGLEDHVHRSEVDTPEHLEAVTNNYRTLLAAYREWAISHAHVIYRIGDEPATIALMINGVYRWT